MSTLGLYQGAGSLAVLTIAGLVAIAAPRPENPDSAGQETPELYVIKHCNHDEMERRGATCENPQGCWNACGVKCENRTKCLQCCLGFKKGGGYEECRWGCDEVWPPAPPPPPTPE